MDDVFSIDDVDACVTMTVGLCVRSETSLGERIELLLQLP